MKQIAGYVHQAEKDRREISKVTERFHPGLTIEEAYEIQEEIIRQKLKDGHKIVGPKIGITDEEKMKELQIDEPVYGFLFDYMIVRDGGSISLSEYIHPKIEPEIGLVLERDLEGADVTAADVIKATGSVFPAIEIIDSRYKDFQFTVPDLIADNTASRGAVFGTDATEPHLLKNHVYSVTVAVNGEIREQGKEAARLKQAATSVARLVRMLHKKGEKVSAGQPVLTGGITEPLDVHAGDYVHVKIGELGDVSFFVKE